MEELIKKLKEAEVVQYGNFELSSGQESDYKIVLDDAVKNPEILDKITDLMLPYVPNVNVIIGQQSNGDIIAKSLAEKKGVKYASFNKPRGSLKLDGPIAGITTFSVDDVSNTDGSLEKQELFIQLGGGHNKGSMVVVARNPDTTKYKYLISADNLK
jgi:orotate phosphoribosyltransferase